jgi:hypothetical protein
MPKLAQARKFAKNKAAKIGSGSRENSQKKSAKIGTRLQNVRQN